MTTTTPPAIVPDPAFAAGEERLRAALAAEARTRPEDEPFVLGSIELNKLAIDNLVRARATEPPPPPIEAPVVLVGLLRTGTTLLHNLLALHEHLHGPKLWELSAPVAAAGDEATRAQARDWAQQVVDMLNTKAPTLPGVHLMHADRAHECNWLLANTFHSMSLEIRYRVPSYGEWLSAQDLTTPYRWHRHQLEVLMSKHAGRIPVLKCPFHTWYLPELAHTYPGARFVHLHRDPAEAISSTASLSRTLRSICSDEQDLPEIGAYWRDRIVPLTEKLAATRDELVNGAPVLDVRYPDLVADPEGTLRSVLSFLDLPFTEDFRQAVHEYLGANRQGSHGGHRYTPAEFGLNADKLRENTTAYRRRFGV